MIIHPSLPKRKKRKPTAKERALAQSWQELLKKYEPKTKVVVTKTLPKTSVYRRETPHYPSLNTNLGSCTKSAVPVYTGDKMIGIGTLHKSNAVPIFSEEAAVDISRMRRG